MISESYQKEIEERIYARVRRLRKRGALTSKGEKMSLAAIGRAADPPASRVAIYGVAQGKIVSERLRRTIERELGQPYWPTQSN